MSIKRDILLRVRVAFLVISIFALAIIYKITQIQFKEGDRWRQVVKNNNIRYRVIKATRGSIYSDDGSLLATSIPFYKLAFDPTIASQEVFENGLDSLSILLGKYFDKAPNHYKKIFINARKKNRKYVVLSEHRIQYHHKKMMSEWPIFRLGKLKGGVIFEQDNRRYRPFGSYGARFIGYVNNANIGKVGLEYSFNEHLSGKDGEALFQRIAGGNWKPVDDESFIKPLDGADIYTTVNVNIQEVAENALEEALIDNDADFGCVIVMEVQSGKIKAMANLGKVKKGVYRENYNYAIGDKGSTDPGSTFKLASLIALFESTNLDLDYEVETGDGTYMFFDTPLRDPTPEGYGKITLQEAFEKSSSIGIAKLVYEKFRFNPYQYINHLKNLGLDKNHFEQMVAESDPYIKSPSDPTWSDISLPWISIGYESKISPLQILTLYNAVANNGKLVQPIIVKEVKHTNNTLVKYESRVINEKICSDKTLTQVKKALKGVVNSGTAKNIKSDLYTIAGKTSTSQKFKNGQYIRAYHTSFAGYFPAQQPKYSCIVVIDNPKKDKQYGGAVSAPVFKRIADFIFANDMSLHAKETFNSFTQHFKKSYVPAFNASNSEDVAIFFEGLKIPIADQQIKESDWIKSATSQPIKFHTKTFPDNKIPDVVGMSFKDALYILEESGLEVDYVGSGKVLEQSLKPGKPIKKGDKIMIKLGD